jgi:hypothetical protein
VVWPLLWPQSGNSAQNAVANTTFNFGCFRILCHSKAFRRTTKPRFSANPAQLITLL